MPTRDGTGLSLKMVPEHPSASWWTVLPPLPLRGLRSPMVECLENYACRLAKISGISRNRLRFYRGTNAGKKYMSSYMVRPLGPGASWIDDLEYLTGLNYLHCGTLWVLKDVMGQRFMGLSPNQRRWCPQCYREWAQEDLYEPLAWNISLLTTCPVHHCLLESRCPSCSKKQPLARYMIRSTTCVFCNENLAGRSSRVPTSSVQQWVDVQICELIELCASPDQKPLSEDCFSRYISALREQAIASKMTRSARTLIESLRGKKRKPSLREMMNVCVLQAIHVRDMLLAPEQAASRPFVHVWSSYMRLPVPLHRRRKEIEATIYLLDTLIDGSECSYMPPMEQTLKAFKINRSLIRDADYDVYDRYEDKYRNQASPSVLERRNLVFSVFVELFKDAPLHVLNRDKYWMLPGRVAREMSMTEEEVTCVFEVSLLYLQTLITARKHVQPIKEIDVLGMPPKL
jgi:hypothetical protein